MSPAKAAVLYEQALHIQERIAALDANDRQARFDLAARYGKLGDAIWRTDPKRALDLYERALATAETLVSKEQLEILRDSYLHRDQPSADSAASDGRSSPDLDPGP